jgi:hypothetical protein
MRAATNISALVALACVGFAVGDWASHPNAIGMVGILALVAVFGFLLAFLYRPQRTRLAKPPPPPAPPSPKRRKRPSFPTTPPPAGWDGKDDADRIWSDR